MDQGTTESAASPNGHPGTEDFLALKIVVGYLLDFAKYHLRDNGLDQRSLDHARNHFERAFLKDGLPSDRR